ncbi:hypothetical protein [Microvirga puerhi]|uniref:DUF2339 domain-containing protein n=1 Tax=Microvirga puerhi TaxID=2876078 RepID=A0ABS7VSF3_9HYPH|nr:hypothetical protein [Microvirga puerhi]MBZ6077877.1 hypothetical protein [Microvirga puerhi]
MGGLTELAPMAAALFLGLCLIWLLWRVFRRLAGAPRVERREPAFADRPEPTSQRREPALTPTAPAPTVPDAADILALKASIDALTKQIAALERRLAPANTNVPPVVTPAPPPKPAPVDVLAEVPLVVPERRR